MTDHTIRVTSVREYAADAVDPDRLLGKKKYVNLHGWEREAGLQLDFQEELRSSYECSCGKLFYKAEKAAEHLERIQ